MKPLIVANWKMNLGLSDALVLSGQAVKAAENFRNVDIILAPPAIYLYPIREHIKAKTSNLALAAQDVFYQKEGAFTGEISAEMLKKVCAYSIIGHSERRKYFGETDEIVNRKLKSVLENGMKAIVCVGEAERFHLEDHFDYEVKRMKKSGGILDSARKALEGIKKSDFEKIAIAYEPVWAIGTGNCASGAYAQSVCYILKNYLEEEYGKAARELRILYGGSVGTDSAPEIIAGPNIDGMLVGGASLSAKEFKQICRSTSEAYGN